MSRESLLDALVLVERATVESALGLGLSQLLGELLDSLLLGRDDDLLLLLVGDRSSGDGGGILLIVLSRLHDDLSSVVEVGCVELF